MCCSLWGLQESDPAAFQTHLGVRPRLEGKQRTPLSSQVATRISWSPLSGLKGVEPPLPFGERTRDCSPGHAGKEGPQLARTGASQGFPLPCPWAPPCGSDVRSPPGGKTSQSDHTGTTALSNSMKLSHAVLGHPRQTGHGGEV